MSLATKLATAALLLCASTPLLTAQSPVAPSPETQQLIDRISACLPPPVIVKDETPACTSLLTRMQQLHIPGVSVAVVHHGVIQWARGYGIATPAGTPVTPDTLFQAGSISKPIAAMAALHLVQQGKLSLDSDVNSQLTTWKLPAATTAPGSPAPSSVVTLRELLTHTGGTTVHGFPGYAAGAPVPTLVQVLDGQPPANTAAIRIEAPPNTKWNYSGGGYTIMQQLVLDVAHQPFPTLLHDTVLAPIGMTHSTYRQPLPADLIAHAAAPYTAKGEPVTGGAHTYPEMAAAGLWTTPSDLARYIIENQLSLQGKANHVLSADMTKQMMTPGMGSWGLGLQIGGLPAKPYFTHGGVNEGFEALFVGYENNGDGAAIMTNAQGGSRLAAELMSAIATAYNWPDFQPVTRTAIKLAPEALQRFVGTYQVTTPPIAFTFTVENGQLMGQPGNQPTKDLLVPESPTRFFLKANPVEIEFIADDKGEITSLVIHQRGQDIKAVKTK